VVENPLKQTNVERHIDMKFIQLRPDELNSVQAQVLRDKIRLPNPVFSRIEAQHEVSPQSFRHEAVPATVAGYVQHPFAPQTLWINASQQRHKLARIDGDDVP
jgi:hypothetical protein